ncbi:4-hydroxy-tetrahydrodipicolinate synthase [Sporosarcina sp. NCCP-2716]|uniref:4-hydroxy-tetrahydrodipicolinate synthase n=1 Tax=Sporosarcina sp. NCCP-2716 TaxID=2943679 RepID=UPI0020406728|nr:4-hydroxy-tetrahydrodipicolinate synthase [Sporosarcina sp. NCCP-2716]GKV67852.1 4-hydroxy-tetrahydrodipicolinate synthase [Sporosarcina sp. NCCP-2716]
MELGQIGTAMVTPFDRQGAVDLGAASLLVDHLLSTGTDSLIVNGTTGESPTLSEEEKEQLLTHIIRTADKKAPVIAGVGTNDTRSSIRAAVRAQELGADGVMLVVPYYNKPDQQGMYEHFKAIAEQITIPVLLYNIPGRSGVNMTAETVIRLSQISNIRAVKEASGDLTQMTRIIAGTHSGFSVYSGDDALTLPLLAVGGSGVISVTSHIAGSEMRRMVDAYLSGRHRTAEKMHQTLLPLFEAVFSKPNPVPVKYYLNQAGIPVGDVRLPLTGMPGHDPNLDDTLQRVKAAAERLFG